MTGIRKGTYEKIAKEMASGKCVLFLGAGASYGDKGEKGVPKAAELAKELSEKLKRNYNFRISKDAGLPKIAQCFEAQTDRETLEKYIKGEIGKIKDPLKIHKIITNLPVNLPVKIIITTNYDQLLETQFDEDVGAIDYKTIIDDEELIENWNDQDVMIMKIHGSIESAKKLVITEDDYVDSLSRETLIKHALRFIMATKTILFIGYSLADYDIRVLLKQIAPQKSERASHYLIQDAKINPKDFSHWKGKGIEAYRMEGTKFLESLRNHYESLKPEDKIGEEGKFLLMQYGADALDYWEGFLITRICDDIKEKRANESDYEFRHQLKDLFLKRKNQEKLIIELRINNGKYF